MIRRLVAAAVIAGLQITGAAAQDYPTRPITINVPFPAGGPTDTLARILGDRDQEPARASGGIRTPTGCPTGPPRKSGPQAVLAGPTRTL